MNFKNRIVFVALLISTVQAAVSDFIENRMCAGGKQLKDFMDKDILEVN